MYFVLIYNLKIVLLIYFLTPHLLPSRHDIANAVQYVTGTVGKALEIRPTSYTA